MPKVSSVKFPVASTYAFGSSLDFQIIFDEQVAVTGSPCFEIYINSSTKKACYLYGNGTTTLQFSYEVEAGLSDNDGISIGTHILLEGGSIKNATSFNANLSLNLSSYHLSTVLIDTATLSADKVLNLNQTDLNEARTEVSFEWQEPNDNGNSITSYSVRYRKVGSSQFTYLDPMPTTTSSVISNLDTESSYEIQVAAFNGVMGAYSNLLSVSTVFNPASLGALIWYEAKDILGSGSSVADGTAIASFIDKSGNQNNANFLTGTQATIETVDSKKVIRLGAGGYRTIFSLGESLVTDIEVYIVAKTRQVTNSFAFVNENQGNNNRYGSHFPWGNGVAYVDLTMGNRMQGAWGGNTTDFFAWTFRSSTTQGKALERNGVQILTAGNKTNTAPLKKWTLGSNYNGVGNLWQADMQAIFVFNKVLSSSQRSDFFQYIELEYGVQMQ